MRVLGDHHLDLRSRVVLSRLLVPRYEADRGGWFFEIERDGAIVRTCRGNADKVRRSEKEYPAEDDARFWAARTTQRSTWNMKMVGPSRVLERTHTNDRPGSTVLAQEYWTAGDDRFVGELMRIDSAKWLASRAELWANDKRPWARRTMLAYILAGCDQPEHKALVKRLYKHVEAASDDAAIAHFMVAFDQLGHRLLIEAAWRTGLRANPELLPAHEDHDVRANRFSRATRQYLARRAYRYFRRIGYRDPARYVRCILLALPHYRDEPLASPAGLLDAWGLMQSLYGESESIIKDPRGIKLADDASLADLSPSPRWPEAWKADDAFSTMIEVLLTAQSRTVRNWMVRWLRLHHAAQLAKLPLANVKRLMFSQHEEIQVLGGELFGKLEGLAALAISEWLELLAVENLDVASMVVSVVAKHVSPSRLTLEQCIALSCAPVAPVARLGLAWTRGKTIESAAELAAITRIARARVPTVRSEGTAWVTSVVTAHPNATPEHLRDLCDAPFADAREHALTAVAHKPELSPPQLWFALTESPYPDVRDVVVENAKKWRDDAPPRSLRRVWSSAMLNVHRGSATKRRVPRQIAERIVSHRDEAEELLPILRIALRSVRPAERAAALGALARAMREN
ncbi:MAG: hypothetical protein AB7L28_02810, partial [Kofleriaceae bacterium]